MRMAICVGSEIAHPADIKAVQRGERGLRIQIDRKHSIALQGEMLGQMRGRGGLTRPSLEINDANDLQLFARDAIRSVSARTLARALRSGCRPLLA